MGDKLFVTEVDCQKLLQCTKRNKSKLIKYKMNLFGDSPVGFLGNHYRLVLNVSNIKDDNDNVEETLRFFVKTVPKIDEHAKYVEEYGAFKKEVLLFSSLLPKLQDITAFLYLSWSPRCLIAKEDCLIFQDLSIENYRLADGRGMLDLDHCIAVMKTLADFHSASIIWENKNKRCGLSKIKINELYPELIKEIVYVQQKGHTRTKWLNSGINGLEHLCEMIGREKGVHLIESLIKESVSIVGTSNKWCNVLSHGDLWSNNLMFRYNDAGQVTHCKLVDFQLSRYAPCALDLMCCIHLIASKSLRNSHFLQLVNTYYERMAIVLLQAGINLDSLMTRKELAESCDVYRRTALAEACLYGISIYLPENIIAEVLSTPSGCIEVTVGDRKPIVERGYREDTFFKDRMNELINELLDCGEFKKYI